MTNTAIQRLHKDILLEVQFLDEFVTWASVSPARGCIVVMMTPNKMKRMLFIDYSQFEIKSQPEGQSTTIVLP